MKALKVLLMAAVLLLWMSATGCKPGSVGAVLLGPISESYDLRVTVVSHTDGSPLAGAFVKVVQTRYGDYTDANGQTGWLATPAQATQVDVYLEYGQINTTVTVGLSKNSTYNQPRIALAPSVAGSDGNLFVRQLKDGRLELLDANHQPWATTSIGIRVHEDEPSK